MKVIVLTGLSILVLMSLGCSTVIGTKDADSDPSDSGSIDNGQPVEFGGMSISPGSVDFGNVKVGRTGTGEVVITNPTDEPRLVTNAYTSGDDDFDVDEAIALPLDVDAGTSTVLTLTFTPTTAESAEATLYVGVQAAAGYAEIRLSGTGTSGGSSNPGDDTGTPATGDPELSFDTISLDFGEVGVDATSGLPLTVTNTGDAPALITGLTITHEAFDIGPSFSVPAVIDPGASETIPVEFTPISIEPYSAIMDFTTDPNLDTPYIELFGLGAEGSCTICAPVLSVSAESLSMSPAHTYGCTASGAVVLSNSGDRDLEITGVRVFNDTLSTCGTFSRSWAGSTILAPAESTTVVVDYVASSSCMDEARPALDENLLRIQSDDPDRPEVFVSLAATALLCE